MTLAVTTEPDAAEVAFAAETDPPIRYIDRTHAWYGALGYGNPYRYAQFTDVPFAPLSKPLSASRITICTTAAPFRAHLGDQGPTAPYNAAAKFYEIYAGDTTAEHDLRVSHVGVDRPHLSGDSGCWFPLPALQRAARTGVVGSVAPHFFGVPTNRSLRHTLEVDAPDLLQRCLRDEIDAAILVPNCPVCHQTMSLMARTLEKAGIPTLVMGTAKDIVELCGVPRFLFSDFPLGNAAGRPDDVASQDATLALGLRLLESAPGSRTTVQNSLKWKGSPTWHTDYLNLSALSADDLADLRAKNDGVKKQAREVRELTFASGS